MSKGKTLKDYPNILKQWDYEKNGSVDPLIVPSKSNKQYYWICEKGHESYICSVEKKVGRLFGCPICSNHKIVNGINDFQSKHPELMDDWYWELNDNEKIIPSKLGPVSSHLAWWKCQKCGGVWKASISNRVRMHSGCPYCANLKVKKGYNDLLTLRPELAEQWDYEKNGDLKPDEVVALSSRKIWWKCEKGHSWQATPNQRVKTNCPYCSNHKVLAGFNDFATTCPKEASQWDYEKNGDKLPIHYTRGSETKVWWKCEKGHSWRARIAERGRGQGCPICSNQKVLVGYNDLASTNPELIKEWDYSNNSVSPQDITSGSNKRVWWICEKCGHSWKSIVSTRVKGYGCPKCGAERSTIGRLKTMAKNNGLFKRFPDLIKEWDFEKNKHIDITLLAASSNKFAWWKCEKGHSYRTRICSRTLHGVGCPYCHNQKVLKGINDLQTLNPSLFTLEASVSGTTYTASVPVSGYTYYAVKTCSNTEEADEISNVIRVGKVVPSTFIESHEKQTYYFVKDNGVWKSNNQGAGSSNASSTWTITPGIKCYYSFDWVVSGRNGGDNRLSITVNDSEEVYTYSINSGTVTGMLNESSNTITAYYRNYYSTSDGTDYATITFRDFYTLKE